MTLLTLVLATLILLLILRDLIAVRHGIKHNETPAQVPPVDWDAVRREADRNDRLWAGRS